MQHGAKSVSAYVVHGVLSGKAIERVSNSPLLRLVTSNSIPATEASAACKNIEQLTIAPLLAEAIKRIAEDRSISALFK